MPFRGGPLDGQPVNPQTLQQADSAGALDLQSLLAGIDGGGAGMPPAPGGGAAGPSSSPPLPPLGSPPADPAAGGPLPNGLPPEQPSDQGAAESEVEVLDRIISDMLSIAGGNELSQQDKASIQKAMTLVQQIKANEEKDKEAAMGGKLSPRLLSKAYGG